MLVLHSTNVGTVTVNQKQGTSLLRENLVKGNCQINERGLFDAVI